MITVYDGALVQEIACSSVADSLPFLQVLFQHAAVGIVGFGSIDSENTWQHLSHMDNWGGSNSSLFAGSAGD